MVARASNKRYKYNDGDIINGFKLLHRGQMSEAQKSCISTFECPFCHREFQADLYNISSTKHHYKSCGCKKINPETGLSANIKDLTGKRFGMLTVDKISGEQHFHIPTNKKSTFFTQEEIDNIQYRDMIKIKYCKRNDYDLIRIPYMNYDILDENYFINKLIIHKKRGTWTR